MGLLDDRDLAAEIMLLGEVMAAVADVSGELTDSEVDAVLGVAPAPDPAPIPEPAPAPAAPELATEPPAARAPGRLEGSARVTRSTRKTADLGGPGRRGG